MVITRKAVTDDLFRFELKDYECDGGKRNRRVLFPSSSFESVSEDQWVSFTLGEWIYEWVAFLSNKIAVRTSPSSPTPHTSKPLRPCVGRSLDWY